MSPRGGRRVTGDGGVVPKGVRSGRLGRWGPNKSGGLYSITPSPGGVRCRRAPLPDPGPSRTAPTVRSAAGLGGHQTRWHDPTPNRSGRPRPCARSGSVTGHRPAVPLRGARLSNGGTNTNVSLSARPRHVNGRRAPHRLWVGGELEATGPCPSDQKGRDWVPRRPRHRKRTSLWEFPHQDDNVRSSPDHFRLGHRTVTEAKTRWFSEGSGGLLAPRRTPSGVFGRRTPYDPAKGCIVFFVGRAHRQVRHHNRGLGPARPTSTRRGASTGHGDGVFGQGKSSGAGLPFYGHRRQGAPGQISRASRKARRWRGRPFAGNHHQPELVRLAGRGAQALFSHHPGGLTIGPLFRGARTGRPSMFNLAEEGKA